MNLYNYIKENGVEKYINIDKFIIENGYLISKYPLFDENKKNLAYIINFMELKSINLENIKHIKIQTTLGTVISTYYTIYGYFSILFKRYKISK